MNIWPSAFPAPFAPDFVKAKSFGIDSSPPVAADGWDAYWQTLVDGDVYSDAVSTPAANNDPAYQLSESFGVISSAYFRQTGASGIRPTFKTGGANGKSYLSFDGSDDYMESLAASNFYSVSAKSLTVAITIKTGWVNNTGIIGDTTSQYEGLNIYTAGVQYYNYGGGEISNPAAFSNDETLVVSFKHDTNKLYARKNGAAWDAGVTTTNTGTLARLFALGKLSASSNYGLFNFYAALVANTVLSDDVFSAAENYFMQQLGI